MSQSFGGLVAEKSSDVNFQSPSLSASNISHQYGNQTVMSGINMAIRAGESLAIAGPSGCGKSTLLAILSGLITPTSGEVHLGTQRIDDLPDREKRQLRLSRFAFVFQFGDLIPELRAIENVELQGRLLGLSKEEMRIRAMDVMSALGVADKSDRRVGELSGGEMQRVAVARAICLKPQFVFADEPTGALDDSNTTAVIGLLLDSVQKAGSALVLVTHDTDVAKMMHRQVRMKGGQLVE